MSLCVLTCPLQGSLPRGTPSWWGRRDLHNLRPTVFFSAGPSTCWAQPVSKVTIKRSSSSCCFFFFFFFLFLSACSCPLLLGPPFLVLSLLRLQKQQWQQMKMKAMRTTKGRPNSTARQTVLKMPSSCLVRMSSKMELKEELIFCCMSAPEQAACAAPSA
uniref:Uncharacterized protein n=1 Tax=Cyanoderma ruficeps TaxID=181631 RepID=A0A8C3RIK4_9PASS